MTEERTCDGCGKPLGVVEATMWSVCMDCTKARARSAFNGRCHCGRLRVPGRERSVGSRRWIPCQRCLGTIKQVA